MPESSQQVCCSSFLEGDVQEEWLEFVKPNSIDSLCGTWEVIPTRSDSCDKIMAELGIGVVKRYALKNYKSQVEIELVAEETIQIITKLPLGVKKQGRIKIDGTTLEQFVRVKLLKTRFYLIRTWIPELLGQTFASSWMAVFVRRESLS